MCYAVPYQAETRECLACGSFTSVHMRCAGCEAAMCDCCDHGSGVKHFCSQECLQDVCDHEDVHYELFDDVCPGRVYYYEIWTCNDCGARIDREGNVIRRIRRAS
jgi:hypothetical protein